MNQNGLNDIELFQQAKTSEVAFELLYRTYSPVVYAWFRKHVTSSATDAADLTAETFARVVLSLRRFRGDSPGSGTAWLFAIVHHIAVDYRRKSRVESRAAAKLGLERQGEPSAAEDIEARLSARRERANLAAAFEKLSARQRDAVSLRVVSGLEYGEIAEKLESTNQAARHHVMRGLRRLREVMQAPQEDG
jgi:RNA polymerase sigma-70 factor (ECF subfamily)